MSQAERIVEVTRRMYLIALRPDCTTLTRAEIERLAEEELAVEHQERTVERSDS